MKIKIPHIFILIFFTSIFFLFGEDKFLKEKEAVTRNSLENEIKILESTILEKEERILKHTAVSKRNVEFVEKAKELIVRLEDRKIVLENLFMAEVDRAKKKKIENQLGETVGLLKKIKNRKEYFVELEKRNRQLLNALNSELGHLKAEYKNKIKQMEYQ